MHKIMRQKTAAFTFSTSLANTERSEWLDNCYYQKIIQHLVVII